jgi:hypothetical protein
MSEFVVTEDSFFKVVYSKEASLLKIIWNGTQTHESYTKAFLSGLDFQEKCTENIDNFISDIQKQGVVNPENRKWFEQVALPRAVNQGLKRGAVIFDGNVFKKYYLNLILQATNVYKLPFKFFTTEKEALAWFESFNR